MRMYYVKKLTGKEQRLLAGPFKSQAQAEQVKERLQRVDTDDCPQEYITPRKSDVKVGFLMVSRSNQVQKTWFGQCEKPLKIIVDLFADHR